MQSKIGLIKNSELPQEVKKTIGGILKHRGDIKKFSKVFGITSTAVCMGSQIFPAFARGQHLTLKDVAYGSGILAFMTTTVGLHALAGHSEEYAKEELGLFHAVKSCRYNPKIKELLVNYPYIVVNRNGDLVGKKINPRIGFIPFGRRRIATQEKPKKLSRLKAAFRKRSKH